MPTVSTDTVHGYQVISIEAFVRCNTRAHRPYLAKVDEQGEFSWQEKVYLGYGKHAATYYVVEELEPGDYIQMAGGSGSNTYPFKGRVVERTDSTLTVEQMSDKDFSNVVALRKRAVQKAEARIPVEPPY